MTFPTLNLPQPPLELLYCHAVDIWREDDLHLDGDGQMVGNGLTGTRIATAQMCYLEGTPNETAPAEFLQMETDNFLSRDKWHFPADADVQATDVLKLVSFPKAAVVGLYWRVRGNPEDHDFIAGKQIISSKQTVKPSWVTG